MNRFYINLISNKAVNRNSIYIDLNSDRETISIDIRIFELFQFEFSINKIFFNIQGVSIVPHGFYFSFSQQVFDERCSYYTNIFSRV